MLNYKIILYVHKTLKDKTHPVVLQLIHNKYVKRYTISKSCKPNQWDSFKSNYSSQMPHYKGFNVFLNSVRSQVDQILTEIATSRKPFTFERFEQLFKGTSKPSSLFDFIKQLIAELEEKGKVGNRNIYLATFNSLVKFNSNPNLQLEDVDYNYLINFERFKIKEGCGNGGLSVHMRTIRAIINEAINRGYLNKDLYPFSTNQAKYGKYKISKLKSSYNPRGLSKVDMDKIKQFDSDSIMHLKHAHLYFLFSYYTGGMSFIDMAYLKWTNIAENRINYNRKKVGSRFSVRITEPIKVILDYFSSNKSLNQQYIFPILDCSPAETYSDRFDLALFECKLIKKRLKECNQHLKEIQKRLEIQTHLTTYVSRHSYAQALKYSGFSDEIISKKLGHQDLNTTKHYLNQLQVGELDYVDNDL